MINKEYKNVFIKKFKAFFKSLIYNSYSLFNKNIFLPGTINLQKKVVSAKSTEIREININNDDIFKITIESNFHTLKNQNVNKFKIDFGYSEKPPNGYWEIKNAIYHPSYHCLFSDLGKRIDFSCYSTKLLCMPEYLEIPKKLKFTDEEFIYIGDFMAEKHYGHFLIEATSSLFYILNNRATKVLCNEISRPFKTTFIDLFYKNFIEDKVFFKFTELVQINSVIIPYPTLKFGNCIYNSHKIPFELVANNIVSKNSKNRTAKKEKAIYLSRRKSKKTFRKILREEELENKLVTHGVKIIYPESLNLIDQIKAINNCDTIIGCKGSALHTLLFDISPNKKIFIIEDTDNIDITFPMIDIIKAYNTQYIGALIKTASNKPDFTIDRTLDVEFAFQKLIELDAI